VTPADVLAALTKTGCRITVEGDALRVRGPLTDDLRAAIRENKAALLELLRPFTPPVLARPDPLDFRRDPLTGAWLHDPGWWRGPAQVREIHEPRAPCPRCGGRRFWVSVVGSRICATCYPPRPGDGVLGWIAPKEVH
jgi:hypothetical protein